MSSVEVVRRVRETKLASASELFEVGALEAGPPDASFVRRLNTVMVRRRADMEKNIPATLADAINAKGALRIHAELVVFGNWLIDSSPRAKPRPGKQADTKKLLKCVAAIMAEIELSALKKQHAFAPHGRESRKREITKHDLVSGWKMLFGENVKPSMFDAKLRTIQLILPDYLRDLKSGSAIHIGKKIRTSPEIERVLVAITSLLPASHTDWPDILTEPDMKQSALLVPFEIELGYQSDAHEKEYRNLSKGAHPAARLKYVPKRTTATSTSGNMRADRAGKIILEPVVHIRRDYRTEALIDRLVILVEARANIENFRLQKLIANKTGATTYVHDLQKWRNPGDNFAKCFLQVCGKWYSYISNICLGL